MMFTTPLVAFLSVLSLTSARPVRRACKANGAAVVSASNSTMPSMSASANSTVVVPTSSAAYTDAEEAAQDIPTSSAVPTTPATDVGVVAAAFGKHSSAASSISSAVATSTSSTAPASSSSSAAPATSSSSGGGDSPVNGGNQGTATYYAAGLGACGWTNSGSDYVVAVNQPQWDQSNCGKDVKITNPTTGKTTTAQIADLCPGCAWGDLDMSTSLFSYLNDGNMDAGVFQMDWTIV